MRRVGWPGLMLGGFTMENLLPNNILSNPQGWARQFVGTARRYRWAQFLFVFEGCMLMAFFVLTPRGAFGSLIAALWIFISAVQFPLMLLRALRACMPYLPEPIPPRGFEVITSDE